MRLSLLAAIHLLVTGVSVEAAFTLVPAGAGWRYFAEGPAPTNWQQLTFDGSAWPSGPAQLGYGENDEETVVANPGHPPSTIYFRHLFGVTNKSSLSYLTLRIVGDDGVVVYLNGTEVARRNLPTGAVSHATSAVANLETNENVFAQYGVPATFIRSNDNVLAVELHQHPEGMGDGSFDLELLANVPFGLPSVEITRPADGIILENGPILFETASSDPDGHVTAVHFYTNGVFMAQASREPFSLLWLSPPAGRHRVTADAFDNFGYHRMSAPVHVQVGAALPLKNIRGPYLQSASPTGMVLRWRTDWPSDSVVWYGNDAGLLTQSTTNGVIAGEHEVRLTGLQPDTFYHYSIGSSSQILARAANFKFRTAPTNDRPVRLWVIGDSGTADGNAASVRNSYLSFMAGQYTDLWLMLGDNAYGSGTDLEYQRAVFNMYGELLPQTVLWPALGNHDAGDSEFGDTGPHRNSFTLPAHGESGGVASGSELYYSFDYGNSHFVCLDAFTSDRSVNGPMLAWLRSDLAATDKDWIIAFWHHPPYSWGSHNSDDDPYQTEMRERALPILEEFGTDLILCGHNHVYERSYLLNGHYGVSSELQPSMILDAGLGQEEAGGPYRKASGGLGGHQGTVYVVCGCSGEGGSGGFAKHPVMAVNSGGFGSMSIEIDGLVMSVKFLRDEPTVGDHFTIDKSGMATNPPHAWIERRQKGVAISWPTSRPAYRLEQAGLLPAPGWAPVSNGVETFGRRNLVEFPTNGPSRFFRLRAEP